MKLRELSRLMAEGFRIKKNSPRSYLVFKDGKVLELMETERVDMDYETLIRMFESSAENISDRSDLCRVGQEDMYPDIRIRPYTSSRRQGGPGGMFLSEDDPIFGERETRGLEEFDDQDVPPLARFDPHLPTKDRKKGKGPDPDHFGKPGGSGDLF
jgi:hypothetical protein